MKQQFDGKSNNVSYSSKHANKLTAQEKEQGKHKAPQSLKGAGGEAQPVVGKGVLQQALDTLNFGNQPADGHQGAPTNAAKDVAATAAAANDEEEGHEDGEPRPNNDGKAAGGSDDKDEEEVVVKPPKKTTKPKRMYKTYSHG